MSGRVLWITGYSGSGKTTVARKVVATLREGGAAAIHLDGDELRSIFAGKWGYARSERLELARTYFRLASHLAAQQQTVVLSAIALYDEVSDWVRSNIPGAVQVYLRVPEEERRRRDAGSKNVYAEIGNVAPQYDEPRAPDLLVDNYGATTADAAAAAIVVHWRTAAGSSADRGRRAHWSAYYRGASLPLGPSDFARAVCAPPLPGPRLLEVGCGNGRDAVFFAANGLSVTAIDMSEAAIARCAEQHRDSPAEFLCGTLPQLESRLQPGFDVVYSRFCLHAMTDAEELEMLAASQRLLRPGGALFLECRSINDPLARRGEVISPTERIDGHYRRFVIPDELQRRLRASGFAVREFGESNGWARLGDDDPVVIRAVAERMAPA